MPCGAGMSAGHTLGRWHVQPSFLTIYGTSNGDGTGLTTAIASTLDGNGSLASDPRREPLLNPWADDREPGCGLARAIVIVVTSAVFGLAVWSVLP